ncbi:hypothetical protein [uncultured Algibacter sp.]|uniref:hypothetical protein n=1 Tax=uncultured Algibacter sp. TaxID=298659 RepID=UPI003216A58A
MVVSFNCTQDDEKIQDSSSIYKPSGVISQERAIDLNKAWASKNASLFNKAGESKFESEIQSHWWSLEDLRNYLDYAEHEAELKGYNMTGVRVYLAAYPEKNNQNTLFFAPTGHKAVSQASMLGLFLQPRDEDMPINPLNEGGGGAGGYPD